MTKVLSATALLSGPIWVARFPNSSRTSDLAFPFRQKVEKFLEALDAASADVVISATRRSRERAFLMHWAFRIARENYDPTKVPELPGVDIEWVHRDARGNPDVAASRIAAARMVEAYDIAFRPATTSRHIEGLAIDMDVHWTAPELKIRDGAGRHVTIKHGPKNGAANPEIHHVGRSYGVIKLASDPPHWSSDGH